MLQLQQALQPTTGTKLKISFKRHLASLVGLVTVKNYWTTLRDTITRAVEKPLAIQRRKVKNSLIRVIAPSLLLLK